MWQGHGGLVQLHMRRHSPQGIPLRGNTKPGKLTPLCPAAGLPAAPILHASDPMYQPAFGVFFFNVGKGPAQQKGYAHSCA